MLMTGGAFLTFSERENDSMLAHRDPSAACLASWRRCVGKGVQWVTPSALIFSITIQPAIGVAGIHALGVLLYLLPGPHVLVSWALSGIWHVFRCAFRGLRNIAIFVTSSNVYKG